MNLYINSVMCSALLLLAAIWVVKEALMRHPEIMDELLGEGGPDPNAPAKLAILAFIPIINIMAPLVIIVIFSNDELIEKFLNEVHDKQGK